MRATDGAKIDKVELNNSKKGKGTTEARNAGATKKVGWFRSKFDDKKSYAVAVDEEVWTPPLPE